MGALDKEAAARLARAIVQDIALYHQAVIDAEGDLSEPIAEGRALFRARAAERAHGAFEDALRARGLDRLERTRAGAQVARASADGARPAPSAAHASFLEPLPPRPAGNVGAALLLVALLGVAALAAWVVLAR